jgi:hypothetical protein
MNVIIADLNVIIVFLSKTFDRFSIFSWSELISNVSLRKEISINFNKLTDIKFYLKTKSSLYTSEKETAKYPQNDLK